MNAVGGNVRLMGQGNVPLGLRFLLISIVSASSGFLPRRLPDPGGRRSAVRRMAVGEPRAY